RSARPVVADDQPDSARDCSRRTPPRSYQYPPASVCLRRMTIDSEGTEGAQLRLDNTLASWSRRAHAIASDPMSSTVAGTGDPPINFSPPTNMNIAARPICASHSATRATRPRGMAGVSLAVIAVEKRVVMIRFLPFDGYRQILR